MKDFKIYVVVASILLVVYLVAQYNQPKAIDWTQSLNNTDKIPFGTYVIYNQLHDIFANSKIQSYREPVYNVINDHAIEHGTYIIICNEINLNEYDYSKLTRFIRAGNDVFIAASFYGDTLSKKLKIQTRTNLFAEHQSPITFTNKNIAHGKFYNLDKHISDNYFVGIDTLKDIVLGENMAGKINFIKIPIGKGFLYLNANPLMFSNYSILQTQGADYAAKALSYTKNDKNVVWDEYYTQGRDGEGSEMRVFLRNTALRWAFYIAFGGLLAFVIYEMKRRQRVIPVIEPLNNTSIDFVNVVGQVYYEQRNNNNIAQKKATYFLEHVRTKYHLKTSVLNEEFLTALSQKSGAEPVFLQKLLNQITIIRSGVYISDRDLISFNQNIEQFYIQSR